MYTSDIRVEKCSECRPNEKTPWKGYQAFRTYRTTEGTRNAVPTPFLLRPCLL